MTGNDTSMTCAEAASEALGTLAPGTVIACPRSPSPVCAQSAALALRAAALALTTRRDDAAEARVAFEARHPESAELEFLLGRVYRVGRIQCAICVIVLGDGCSEHGHHGVTNELHDGS